jgi:hypothetical protein
MLDIQQISLLKNSSLAVSDMIASILAFMFQLDFTSNLSLD